MVLGQRQALLSSFSRAHRQQILRNLPLTRPSRNTITDPQELETALQSIAETGLGVDNEEFIDGMVACSVPSVGRRAACMPACSCMRRRCARSLDELEAMEPLLRRAADELAELLLEARPQDGPPSA
ncbi:IclR family transcriptional regulator domain-containing protein [Azorhizophilus paspali]|uniref:IclR family transcriptional regulator C-terminal domain-containing protein n=1 Tax=Azorhizophilus paspali TaxID=69963 RepID=A0ABV6SPZ2_AZOPA